MPVGTPVGSDGNYSRPISATEAWFLVYPQWLPGVIQVVVEGTGPLGADELTAAVAAASQACPGARLTRMGRRWVDSTVAPAVRVLDAGAFDPVAFTGLPELHQPLTGEAGAPTCEVLLLPGTPARPTSIVFRANHAVMDGKGVLIWIDEIFRALRGDEPIGAPSRITEHELLERITAPRSPAIEADLEWPSALGSRPAGPQGFFWRRKTVDGVHPALVAKIALAVTAACDLPTGRFRIPVDLRRYDPAIRSTGNLTHNPLLDVTAGSAWEDAHERLLTILSSGQDLAAGTDPALANIPRDHLRRQLMALDDISASRGRYGSVATISHVGRIDLDTLRGRDFHATTIYSLPNSGPVGPPEINAVECGGRTEITLGWYDRPELVERAVALLDAIEEALSPRHRRVWAGNDNARPLARPGTVVEQFAAQVARTPDAIALTSPEGNTTYAELDRYSSAVAADLQRRGLGRDDVVGLFAGRTVAAMAAIWGILKAGAAYLPLDPQHPDHRLAGLLADAGVTVCLTEARYRHRGFAPPGCTPAVIEELAAGDGTLAPVEIRPEDLAYVIYTSGSTGRPKGVEIEHRNLATFVSWSTRVYGVDEHTRFPLFSSLAFDLSNTAIFLPVLAGGSIALVPDELNHMVLQDMLLHRGANKLKLTPTHLDLIGRLGLRPEGFTAVIAGGELLRTSVTARAQEAFGPQCRIFNEYGPTETTIGNMTRTFDAQADADLSSVPIGVPTDNSTIYLVDTEGRFVEPGEVGEMLLGGAQLCRGYRGRPDLNRERFTVLASGERVYRSGDLARQLPSGELESVGRNDEQIKVRGYRIEPAEVARALEEHPAVARAFAVGRTRDGSPDKILCAYVVPAADVSVDALDEHVGKLLPPYMVPGATVLVPELPRTANGKVDVAALPDPFADQGTSAATVTALSGEVETAVAGIWARTLAVDVQRLSGDADFHRLGGDSAKLLAMLAAVCNDIVGRGRETAFMSDLSKIIREPTITRISDLARQARSAAV
ncbi:amino acid adenylation domain-containing protein [Dactylosporangium sp. CA-139114]|uniref:amino acid adenylation domain-containing protein n=1 Tax=Dactylosporangium sp. CA-139114 TaxID=3239931 RepID=UPI003D9759AF